MNSSAGLGQVPVWVWLVLAYGLWVGIRAFQTRKVSLWMAGLMPVAFLGLSLSSLAGVATEVPLIGLAWVLSVAAGGSLGWFFFYQEPLEVHSHRRSVVVPGTWIVLVLFLMIFAAKFAYGFLEATQPEVAGTPAVRVVIFGLSGLATGIVTGRTVRLYTEVLGAPRP